MKKIYTIIGLLFVLITNIQAQGNVGIGTNTPDASAKLDISLQYINNISAAPRIFIFDRSDKTLIEFIL